MPADDSTTPTPALFFRDRNSGLSNPLLFGSTPAEHEDLTARDDSRQYTPAEWLFLTEIVRYFKGAEDLRRGLVIPDEFWLGEYLEGIGSDGQVSLRLPALESLFVRASRTWPTSVFKTFSPNITAPTPALSCHDVRGNLEAPTPSSTVDDVDELSSTDEEWMYPPTPPRLPTIELPLRQLEDLRVQIPACPTQDDSDALKLPLSALIDVDETSEDNLQSSSKLQQTQGTLEPIPELDELPHPTTPPGPTPLVSDTQNDMDFEPANAPGDVVTHDCCITDHAIGMPSSPSSESTMSSLPSLATPSTSPEPSEVQDKPTSESAWNSNEGWTVDEWPTDAWDAWGVLAPNEEPASPSHNLQDDPWPVNDMPPWSYPQQTSADEMRRTLSRLTAHLIPLTNVRFGSRVSYRTAGRLCEAIPQATFRRFFRDFGTYENLADSISTIRDDLKVPNRWQTHLPRLRRIRQFVTQYIEDAENLLRYHGFIDGLKEYTITHQIEFWRVEKHPNSLFYPHELEYFFALTQFLADESYFDLAYRTQ